MKLLIYLIASTLTISLSIACKKDHIKPPHQHSIYHSNTTSGISFSSKHKRTSFSKIDDAINSYSIHHLNKNLAKKKDKLVTNKQDMFLFEVEISGNIKHHISLFETKTSKEALSSAEKIKKNNQKEEKNISNLKKENLKLLEQITDMQKRLDDLNAKRSSL